MVSSDCMGWVRAHRARLAGAWLAFQTCVLLSIPGRAVDHAAAHSDAHSLRLSPRSRRNLPDASGRLAAVLMSQFG